MGDFVMPSLGAEMDEGRLLEWYVQPGQQVHRGSVIALIETDKADIDVEVFESGIVEELLVEEGTKVPVGTPLARIGAGEGMTVPGADATPATEPAPTQPAAAPAAEPPAAEPPATAPPPTEPPAAVPAPAAAPEPARADGAPILNPVLRRLARDLGVDVTTLSGTGPGGRVTRSDVERAGAAVTAGPGELDHPPEASRPGRSSPYARRLAAERGIDATTVTGTGPGGAVIARDVEEHGAPSDAIPAAGGTQAAASPEDTAATPATGESTTTGPGRASADERYLAMRRSIARAMARSKREIPHYYLGEHVDMEPALAWLADHNAELPAAQRLLPAVLLLKAVASACRDFEDLNGFWEDDGFRPGDGVHVGVAVSLRRGGLLAPAIRDADARSLDELMEALRDLVTRTRNGGLRGTELSDGTITVTNLGDTGVETVYGVIQPPQVALVGAGAVTERPWAADGMVGPRRCLHLTLSADHRASDGHRGALFLAAIAARLREPETL